jgi:hypothetical protein
MKLPTQNKILREDIKDPPAWIGKVIDPFNSLAEFVYQVMNRNITFSENVACFIKEIVYKTTSVYPVADAVEFTNELKVKASGVLVLQAFEKSTYIPAAGPVYVPWNENNGKIVMSSVTGLEASKTYIIRLLIS